MQLLQQQLEKIIPLQTCRSSDSTIVLIPPGGKRQTLLQTWFPQFLQLIIVITI
jgi:hypothetical protein